MPEVKLQLRLPPELHAALVELATREERSLNGQIVYLLRGAMPPADPSPEGSTWKGVRVYRKGDES